MITRLWFRDFKLLRHVSLDLGRFNVIVGRNGVGKSSVLDGAHYLLQLASAGGSPAVPKELPPEQVFSGPRHPSYLVSKPNADSFVIGVDGSATKPFAIAVKLPEDDSRRVTYIASWGENSCDERSAARWRTFLKGPFDAELGSVVRLRLDSRKLAEPHYSKSEHPRVEFDGEGLASVIQYLQGLRDGTIEAIEADLARIVPSAKRIRALPTKILQTESLRVSVGDESSFHDRRTEVTGARFEVEFEGAGWVDAGQLSEGTLLVLGIVTVLRHQAPRLILLDDMDRGLHPVAQLELVRLLRGVLAADEELQIVATSHSPFVLDELEASEAFVASAVDPATSQIQRLDRHPEWEQRARFMRPGEFWSAVGEGWVAERP
ncbi:MAG: AAA family ATPase [Candidatus Eisenbacteria bacterium]|uniref:AAA family ATPase n=1 Tax=Eiseniibacteriota bacterium TaxID=2212470 RepID=A0A956NH85_UNCEI|nr:AAA family ATPase [Candidatus Eisenbacteria bacterium]